jgi:hypothetical protein
VRNLVSKNNVFLFGGIVAAAALAGYIAVVFIRVLLSKMDDYVDPTSTSEKVDVLLAQSQVTLSIVQTLGGLLLFITLLSTLYQAREQLQVSQESQTAERFTKAIDQLGAMRENGEKRIEVRLGGIYALERIAEDAPERYHWTVMEVLSAYVRENASGKTSKAPTDIQAAVTVIGRARKDEGRRNYELGPIDLAKTSLSGASLVEAQLQGAILIETQLQGANLMRAQLQGANLMRAQLQEASLVEAQLQGAYLRRAQLQGAHLWGAQLQGAILDDAQDLTQEQIDSSCMDKYTILPEEPGPDGKPYRRSSLIC